MKTLNLTDAYEILSQCPAIVLEGRVLALHLSDIEYHSANEFLHICWSKDGLDFDIYFNEGDNQEISVDQTTITLVNTDGEEVSFDLLAPWDIESTIK